MYVFDDLITIFAHIFFINLNMFNINTFLDKYYKCINTAYSISASKYIWALTASAIYIFLLVWFAHVDVVLDCYKNNIGTMSDIFLRIAHKHAHILSLITNLGLLSMLFIDLLMANKYDGIIVITLLNLFGVFAMIGIFWCSVGCESNIVDTIGGLGSDNGCIISLIVFIIILLCLKFISLKPCDK